MDTYLEIYDKRPKKTIKKSYQRKTLNDLDGVTWNKYSISVWGINKSIEEYKIGHPAMFPIQLCKRLIKIYTKRGDTVLDHFMGSGITLISAYELERNAIGLDINETFVEKAKKRIWQEKIVPIHVEKPKIYNDDAGNILNHISQNTVDLVITSPPYWDILRQKRTADYKEIRFYSDSTKDIGNIENYDEFMSSLEDIFKKIRIVLKNGKRCIIIVMDLRKKSEFIPFHIDVSNMMQKIGFKFEDIIIWNRQKEYNNLRPLGYPSVFIVNKIHEYILIFKNIKDEV